MYDKRNNSIKTPNHSITPFLDYYGTTTKVEFSGSCVKQDSVTFNHKKVVNICIVYEMNKSFNISDYPTLENCLFGAVTLTKNADISISSTNILDKQLVFMDMEVFYSIIELTEM